MGIQQKDAIIIMLSILSLVLLALAIYFGVKDIGCRPTHVKIAKSEQEHSGSDTSSASSPPLEDPFARPLYTE